jgi:hypothetical protein
MPRLELIFPHSKSADGCNARSVPTAPRLLLKIICCTSRSCRLRHAGAMQIISLCMAPFPACKLFRHLLGFLARPKRFELLTPRFVVCYPVEPSAFRQVGYDALPKGYSSQTADRGCRWQITCRTSSVRIRQKLTRRPWHRTERLEAIRIGAAPAQRPRGTEHCARQPASL